MYHLPSGKTFLVSAKALIVQDKKILLLKNTNDVTGLDGSEAKWELPGGLVEIDEPLEAALIREVLEEIHIEIRIGKVVSVHDRWWNNFQFADGRMLDVRQLAVGYLCSLQEKKIVLSNEHKKFQWIPLRKVARIPIAENSKGLIVKYIQLEG